MMFQVNEGERIFIEWKERKIDQSSDSSNFHVHKMFLFSIYVQITWLWMNVKFDKNGRTMRKHEKGRDRDFDISANMESKDIRYNKNINIYTWQEHKQKAVAEWLKTRVLCATDEDIWKRRGIRYLILTLIGSVKIQGIKKYKCINMTKT